MMNVWEAMFVTLMLIVPTLRDVTFVSVKKDSLEME